MKYTKKLFAVLFALVMVFAMAIPASAATKVTIDGINGHKYAAYQIFTGDVKDGKLINIKYGYASSGIRGNLVPRQVLEDLDSVSEASDAEKLEVISKYLSKSGILSTNGGAVGTTLNAFLNPGYYLFKDLGMKDNTEVPEDGYSTYIAVVVTDEPLVITPKLTATTAEKKVKDINDSTGKATEETLEDGSTTEWIDSADYDIGDKVPFQLKATLAGNVSFYKTYKVIFHDTLAAGLTYGEDAVVKIDGIKTDGFTVTPAANEDGTTELTISCADVRALGAKDYSDITVEYTAALNENAVIGAAGNINKMYVEYSNCTTTSKADSTGTTPVDIVKVFTYQTIINKVDQDGNPLTGAEFNLEKKQADNTWKTIEAVKNEEGTTFTFSGLDDGDYRLQESTTPKGYNSIEPIEFTIIADHEVLSDDPALTSLEAKSETSFTVDKEKGSLSADVENEKGLTLPETGGMGTTLFYILGGIMVLGAGILLIAKKCMSADK